MQLRLVVLDHQQVVPTGVKHLSAERALAEQRIPGQDPSWPGELRQELGSVRQFCLRLGRRDRDRDGPHHQPGFDTDRAQHMDRPVIGNDEAATLGLAINRHPATDA